MIADVFYIIGVIFFFHEVMKVNDAKPRLKRIRNSEKVKEKEDFKSLSDDEQKLFIKYGVFGIVYLMWVIAGVLFSGQWMVFAGLIGFGFLIGFYRRRFYTYNTRKSLRIIKTHSIVSSLILAFLIVNHFHKIY